MTRFKIIHNTATGHIPADLTKTRLPEYNDTTSQNTLFCENSYTL